MKLRPQQKDLVERLHDSEDRGYLLIVWLMREGKTAPVCQYVKDRDFSTLVICPPKVIPVWKEAQKVFGIKHMTILSDGILGQEKKELQRKIGNDWGAVVVDEIHRFRYFSKRYQKLDWLADNAWMRIGLTGTPFDKYLAELYYPLQWLSTESFFGKDGQKVTSKKVFHKVYCSPIDPHNPYTKWEIHPMIAHDFWIEVKEVSSIYKSGKVQAAEHEVIKYRLTAHQEDIISRILHKEPISESIDEVMAGLQVSNLRDKVRQVYGGFFLSSGYDILSCASFKWFELVKLINRLGGKRLVIWYRYVNELHICTRTIPHMYSSDTYTADNLQKFNDDELDILIAHPAAAGAGVDISHAEHAIFVTHSPKWVEVMQAFYRLSKYEDENAKKIYHLVADHKQDIDSYVTLKDKERTTMEFYASSKTEVPTGE